MLIKDLTNVGVVVAHPDDETLGMGGTIHKLTSAGVSVKVLIMSSGVSSRTSIKESADKRRGSARSALKVLGVDEIVFQDFPDNQFDTVSRLSLCKKIEEFIVEHSINTVFTNSRADLNVDHRRIAETTLVACRPKVHSSVRNLFHFEVLSSSEWNFGKRIFSPNFFVDITDSYDLKIEAMKKYEAEVEAYPEARSLESLAAQSVSRGTQVGVERAEAFEISFINVR
jgi:LmbE family N-acetylglucosaminyl deacetylase